ncbi:hypothetical protein MMC25_008249 [Agyrium rufum]|nr:hypothetical protein [Agyrium rufum]
MSVIQWLCIMVMEKVLPVEYMISVIDQTQVAISVAQSKISGTSDSIALKPERKLTFFSLPGEIRNMIYEMHFSDLENPGRTKIKDAAEDRHWDREDVFPTLLMVNKAVYMEAWLMYYTHAKFTIENLKRLRRIKSPFWAARSARSTKTCNASANRPDWRSLGQPDLTTAADLVQNVLIDVNRWWVEPSIVRKMQAHGCMCVVCQQIKGPLSFVWDYELRSQSPGHFEIVDAMEDSLDIIGFRLKGLLKQLQSLSNTRSLKIHIKVNKHRSCTEKVCTKIWEHKYSKGLKCDVYNELAEVEGWNIQAPVHLIPLMSSSFNKNMNVMTLQMSSSFAWLMK